ncbi:MAG: hypothetical protein AB7S44_04245 [Spirochaetales bacterium]
MAETNREKFVRIAENRTNKIIEMIKLLGNCSNTYNYEYTEKDIKVIFDTIESEIKEAKNKFSNGISSTKKFKLL